MYKIVIVVNPNPSGENQRKYSSGWWDTEEHARAEAEYFMEKGEKPGCYQVLTLKFGKAA